MRSGRPESINRKNSTALQGAAEREPFDQSGVWGEFPQQAAGRFPTSGNLPARQVCINAGIACQVCYRAVAATASLPLRLDGSIAVDRAKNVASDRTGGAADSVVIHSRDDISGKLFS